MDNFRNLVRETIKKELEEISATGAAPGFQTPNAFRGDSKTDKLKAKDNAEQAGYKLVNNLTEGRSKYQEYKSDPSGAPRQKIGRAIAEINRAISEIDRSLSMNARLKSETSTQNTQLWKRTNVALTKLESKLLEMVRRVQELKS